jgi:lipopolysaccharide transport system permease protein
MMAKRNLMKTTRWKIPLQELRDYKELILQLWRQEILQEYRESILGLFWLLLYPFFDLVIYTFVFSTLFAAKVIPPDGVTVVLPYGVILLAGLLPYNIIAQGLSAAPSEILRKPNYVKKVRFPVEVLPVVRLGVAGFQGLVALGVLLAARLFFAHSLPWTMILLPIALLPLFFLGLGLGWILSGLGVYFRDLDKIVALGLRVWFFGTPIVYDLSRLPDWALPVVSLNPLTFIVQAVRDLVLWGRIFSLQQWLLWLVVSWTIAWVGYSWFQYAKQGFADVI